MMFLECCVSRSYHVLLIFEDHHYHPIERRLYCYFVQCIDVLISYSQYNLLTTTMMIMIHVEGEDVEGEERRVMIPLAFLLRDDNGYGYGVDARPYNYYGLPM